MAIYRFKVCFEEDEEVIRIIELRSNQTVEDLHFAILKSVEFDTIHNATLFLSDDYWKKGDQYAFQPIGNSELPAFSATRLSSLINDPHQKLLYVYDLAHEWVFLVELVGISMKEDPKISYPHVVRTEGKAPKQYKVQRKVGADLEDDEFDYLTKNLLSGEIAQEMMGEHVDEDETEGMDEEGEEDEENEEGEEDEFGGDPYGDSYEDDTH